MSAYRSQSISGTASSEDHTIKPWYQALVSGDADLARPIPDAKQPFAMKRVVEYIRTFTGLTQLYLMIQWSDINRPIRFGSAGAHPILPAFTGMWFSGFIAASTNLAANYLFARNINGACEVLSASISALTTVLNGLVSGALFRVVMSPYQLDPGSFPNFDDHSILQQPLSRGVEARAFPMGNRNYKVPGPGGVNTDVPHSDATYSVLSTVQATTVPPFRVNNGSSISTSPTTVWSTCEAGDANPALYLSGATKAVQIDASLTLTSGTPATKYADVISYYVNGSGVLTALNLTRVVFSLDFSTGTQYSANISKLFVSDWPIAVIRIQIGGTGIGALTSGEVRITEFGLTDVAPVHFIYCSSMDSSTSVQVNARVALDVVPNLNLSAEVQGMEEIDATTHGAFMAAQMLAQRHPELFLTTCDKTPKVLDIAASAPALTQSDVLDGKASFWDSVSDFASGMAKPLGGALGSVLASGISGLAADGSSGVIHGRAADKDIRMRLDSDEEEVKRPSPPSKSAQAIPLNIKFTGDEPMILVFRDQVSPDDLAALFASSPSEVGIPYLSYWQGRETVMAEAKFAQAVTAICPGPWQSVGQPAITSENRLVLPSRRWGGGGRGGSSPQVAVYSGALSRFGPVIHGRAADREISDDFFTEEDPFLDDGSGPLPEPLSTPQGPPVSAVLPQSLTTPALESKEYARPMPASQLDSMSVEDLKTLIMQLQAAVGVRPPASGSQQSDISPDMVYQARYSAQPASDAGKTRTPFGLGQCGFPLVVNYQGAQTAFTCVLSVTALPVRGTSYTLISPRESEIEVYVAMAGMKPQLSLPSDLQLAQSLLRQVHSLRKGSSKFFLTFAIEVNEEDKFFLNRNVTVQETSFSAALMLAAMGAKGPVNAVGLVQDIYGPFRKPGMMNVKSLWVAQQGNLPKRVTLLCAGEEVGDIITANKMVMAIKVGRVDHPGLNGQPFSTFINSLDQAVFWLQIPRPRSIPGQELMATVKLPDYVVAKADAIVDQRARAEFLARQRRSAANQAAQAAMSKEKPYEPGPQSNSVTSVEVSAVLDSVRPSGAGAPMALERKMAQFGATEDQARAIRTSYVESARRQGGVANISGENSGNLYRKIAQVLQRTKKQRAAPKGRSFQESVDFTM